MMLAIMQYAFWTRNDGQARARATALVVVFGSLVYGCGPSFVSAADFGCQSAEQCVVQVEVNCAASRCTATVDHQSVAAHGHAIVWQVVPKSGQSYSFKNLGGVFFKTPNGQSAFNCRAEMNDKKYHCQGNRDGKTYEYGIELVGTPAVSKVDPFIVND